MMRAARSMGSEEICSDVVIGSLKGRLAAAVNGVGTRRPCAVTVGALDGLILTGIGLGVHTGNVTGVTVGDPCCRCIGGG